MSHIQSMAILGIRSFSPEEPSYIRFFSPLTLIVGPNGSGKTTIIESLRYACTGETPPNSKGGAFVNDPKLAGTNEVKAQVKLKFYNINGQKMVCSRSLSVTQKKSTVSQKSIDNALLRYDPVTGQAFSITSRCADMDAELPLHLGVPKAILDNVVFCHQEDSNWPLSESSVLKKKFDDIFSSKRYAVALDNIKEIRKEQLQEIKIGNVQLDALKADAAKAKRVRSTLTQLNQQRNAKTETLNSIEERRRKVNDETKDLEAMLSEISQTADQIQQIINKKDYYQSAMRTIEAHIVPSEESTEQLKQLLEEHRIKENENQEEKVNVTRERDQLERKLKRAQSELSQKHLDMGRLEASREELERQIQVRTEYIHKINTSQNMDLNPNDAAAASTQLKAKIESISLRNEQLKNEAMNKQNTLSDELQVLKSRLLSLQENKKHLLKRIEQDKKQIESLKAKISPIRGAEVEIKSVEAAIKKATEDLDKFKRDNAGSVTQDDIEAKDRELRHLDEKSTDLNDELARLSKQGDTSTKLSLKQTEKETKETTLNTIYNDCIDDVESLLNERPSIEELEQKLEAYKLEKERELRKVIEIRNTTNRQLNAVEGKLSMTVQNYERQKKEADKLHSAIRAVCGSKKVPEELKLTNEKITTWKERLSNIEGARMIYDKYAESQERGNCCPVCVRDFKDEEEVETFKAQLDTMRNFIPGKIADLNDQLKKILSRKEKLENVSETWVKWETLNNDLVSMKEIMDQLTAQKEEAVNKADVASTNLIEVDNCKIKADKLLLIARNVSRINDEVQMVSAEIDDLECELSFSGTTRSMSDVQQELEEINDKRKLINRETKRMRESIALIEHSRQKLEKSLREKREKLMSLQHNRDFKMGLELQLSELQELMKTHKAECEKIENDVEPLKRQVQKASLDYEQAVREWRSLEEKISLEEREISMFDERLDDFNSNITKISEANGPSVLNTVKAQIAEKESMMKQISDKVASIDEKLSIINKDEAERRGTERDLQDQIKYRELQAQLAECEKDLDEMEEKQGEYNVVAVQQELEKHRNEQSDLIAKSGSIKGEIAQMNDQIRRYEQELSTDYENVDGRYGKLFVEVKTTELAYDDLEKYSKVLQTAIIKYHSLKMQDLNKIIKDLWINTYKGSDIDHIEIRADNEGTTANRSFNYRVVMIKNGSELNMRGRCSAGQKVLASIIIRLALAETFCVNCGVFTLDEPTTNLDRDNIESLAENLANIIRSRRDQANFQFVIITHDEEFVEYLSRHQISGEYYRVHKDQNQHSTITLQSVADEDNA